jgi:hypothetical protein
MTPQEAREILRMYRRGIDDPSEPEVRAALELVRQNPELRRWYEEQSAVHDAIRTRLRSIQPPDHLPQRIIAKGRHNLWRVPLVWAAAAAVILFIAIAAVLEGQKPRYAFTAFRQKMVRTAMGGYDMPLMTNDLAAIRSYIRAQNGHGDYTLTAPLQKLSGRGCVVFPWHSRPVSLVCLDGGQGRDIFLFITDRNSVTGAPSNREFKTIGRLPTASWSDGNKLYILAAKGDDAFLRSLL